LSYANLIILCIYAEALDKLHVCLHMYLVCNTNTTLSSGCPTATTGVTINPDTGPFAPGDVLTCNADGYKPTYTWIGVFNGVSIGTHTGSTYTLEAGDFQVICTATVTQLTCTGTATDSVEGTADDDCPPIGKYRIQFATLVT